MFNTSKRQLDEHEIILFSKNEVSIKLTSPSDSTTIKAIAQLFLSNQRILLIAQPVTYHIVGKGDSEFRSLSLPLVPSKAAGGIQQSKIVQPWFGPNLWEALAVPASDSTFEPHTTWHLQLSFSSGGAFDFVEKFGQAVSSAATARANGVAEPLPAYTP